MIERVVEEGCTVIDATAGNGHDTVFLAKLVGPHGKVYSFDIQKEAIEKTLDRLKKEGLEDRVVLIHDGHEKICEHVKESVRAVMFNLGYLPGENHNIGTKGDTTIAAIDSALKLLEVHGIITVVVYYGGDSGFAEKEQVLEYVGKLDYRQFTVSKTEFINQINCPPILVCIEKMY